MLDATINVTLFLVVIVMTLVVTAMPPITLLVCNTILLVQIHKMKRETRITHKTTATAKNSAKLIASLMFISMWTNVAVLPILAIPAMLLMLAASTIQII